LDRALLPVPYLDAYEFLLTGYRGLNPLPQDVDLKDRIDKSIEELKLRENLIDKFE
jgi:hypothetical protein